MTKREQAERAEAAGRRFREASQKIADRMRPGEAACEQNELELHEAATALVERHGK